MSWDQQGWIYLQVRRFAVGMSSWTVLVGGILVVAGLALSREWADATKPMWAGLVLVFFGGVAAIWDCGRRVLNVGEKNKRDGELGIFLGMLQAKLAEVEGTSAEKYQLQIDPFGTDLRIDAMLWYIKDRLPRSVGPENTALFYDTTGLKHTPVDSAHPFKAIEVFRQNNIAVLKHHVAQLSEIIRRCA
jgi:hypothetical protein